MTVGRLTRIAAQAGAGIAAVFAVWAALRRLEERSANDRLAKGKRFLILGGGFAGAAVAQELAHLLPGDENGEIVLISADNYLLFTPMLTEAAGGELQVRDIVAPSRLLSKRVSFVQGQIAKVDVHTNTVDVEVAPGGLDPTTMTFTGDHVVLALGSVVSFHNTPGVDQYSIPMKRLEDAARIFQRVSSCLERAAVERDQDKRRELLTFVVAGGGYTGVETMAAINDLVRSSSEDLPRIQRNEIRTILVHPGDRLLPEITADLAQFAQRKLMDRGVEVRLGSRIDSAAESYVEIQGGERIPARTLIWAAGVTPSPILNDLPVPKGKHHGVQTDACCRVPGFEALWALGDCAEIPEPDGQGTYAPTAQNATREGKLVARNMVRTLRGEPLKSFRFTPVGELALVGRRSGVARVYGRNFSGLLAWAMWRAIYLAKMPGIGQRSRILTDWTLDTIFGRAAVPVSTGEQHL